MSKSTHDTAALHKAEHGSMRSYVIGFILSLAFTLIPYSMVVNESISGTKLLATIIAIAVVQMIIQVVFFLHLGRERKPRWQLYFLVGTVGGILVVVAGSIIIMNHLYGNMTPMDASKKLIEDEGIYQLGGEKTGACRGVHDNHKVSIKDGMVNPNYVEARRCDTLTFIKEDTIDREITFGTHPDHGNYAGETALKLRPNRGKTITLSETGTYHFHDHLNPETAGYFTVTP
jgi:cytochrome o ubiquinol oxidase operon protein cyoD